MPVLSKSGNGSLALFLEENPMHRISTVMALGAALVLSTLAPASVLAQGYGAMPAGSYQQSCTNVRVRGATLTASCTNNSGQRVRSSLAVNSCTGADIGNVNGQLTCVRTGNYYGSGHGRFGNGRYRHSNNGVLPSGSYQQSCSGASMNGSTLTASCSNNSGNTVTSYLDVSQCRGSDDIGNVNGQLRCIFRP
jgi:hypothetical protein